MCCVALVIYFDEKVADTGFVIADLSEGDILVEDIVEHASGPSAAAGAGAAGKSGKRIRVDNFANSHRSAAVCSSVGFARILGAKLVHEFRHVLDRNGLAVGQSTGSRRAGRFRRGGFRCLRCWDSGGFRRGGFDRNGLCHAVNDSGGLTAVHDAAAVKRTVGITADDAEGIHVGYGVAVLAGDAGIVRNLRGGVVLFGLSGGKTSGVHNVRHELGHVVPGDTEIHTRGEAGIVNIIGIKADVVPDEVVLQREIVGVERTERCGEVVGIPGNVAGIERTGEHDAEVGAGNGGGGPERAVGVAADNALGRTVSDGGIEVVGRGHVGKIRRQGRDGKAGAQDQGQDQGQYSFHSTSP